MKIVGVSNIWIASEAELQRYGLVAGYASPIGVKDVQVVVDDSVVSTTNLVGGANKAGYHLKNLNFPRDFKADIVDDIALVQEDSACVHCGGTLRVKYGITVGNLCKLGTQYSQAMGATYQDEKSKGKPIFMGSYSIEIPRLLASIVEANHDKDGIVWPPAVAPYQLHLMHIGKDEDVIERADALYQRLQQEGYDVLYDDRSGSAGFKFKEADLLGMPVRITVSQRTLEADSVEVKLRSELERRIVRLDTLGDGELSVMLKESVQ
jgi:prolyl-tRNA synthetase